MKKTFLSLILVGSFLSLNCASAGPSAPSTVQPVGPIEGLQSSSSSPKLPKSQHADEQTAQTSFGAEETIRREVNLPEELLQILRHDKRIQTRLGEGPSLVISPSWFAASEIELNNDGRSDLIVQAVNPHLFGANLVPFWVFQKTSERGKLILTVDALTLEVLETKTNGYKNIRTSRATAKDIFITVYEFHGNAYQERHSAEKQINP